MAVRRMLPQVEEWIGAALKNNAGGDRISWEVTMDLLPTGDPRQPTINPCMVAFLTMDTGLVGTMAGGFISMPLAGLTREAVEEQVLGALRQAREQRSQLLATGQDPPPTVSTGRPSGLLLPGA